MCSAGFVSACGRTAKGGVSMIGTRFPAERSSLGLPRNCGEASGTELVSVGVAAGRLGGCGGFVMDGVMISGAAVSPEERTSIRGDTFSRGVSTTKGTTGAAWGALASEIKPSACFSAGGGSAAGARLLWCPEIALPTRKCFACFTGGAWLGGAVAEDCDCAIS